MDIIVTPAVGYVGSGFIDVELKIFEKEMRRYQEIAEAAINYAEAYEKLSQIKKQILKIIQR